MKHHFLVGGKEQGTKLFHFLKARCAELASGKEVKRAIDQKRCTVNGRVQCLSSYLLTKGDKVTIDLTPEEKFSCPILYEDEWFLICNKPAGLESIDKALAPFFSEKVTLVHRLDKETSGALILAKTKSAQEKLEALFAERKIAKTYLAVVDGVVDKEEGKIDNFLEKKGSRGGKPFWGSTSSPRGQRALTLWKCQKRGNQKKGRGACLLVCTPFTGRTHQIRVHLSEMGHPILGDFHYGKRFTCPLKPQRHLLHAYALRFEHPFTHKEVHIKAPIPEDFKHACQTLF